MKTKIFYNKENYKFLVVYQRQGNNRNGNPIYIINIFNLSADNLYNYNIHTGRRLDKYGNIKITSYNIDSTIQSIINEL